MSLVRGVCSVWVAVLLWGAGCDGSRDEPPPEGFAGVFHWEDKPDAYNLSIEPGGRVRWSHSGCDTFRQGHGQWEVRDGKLVLTGVGGGSTVTLERATDFDGLIANGPVLASDGSPTQRWPRGGVCAVCKNPDGGPVLGPVEVRACDNPTLP
ncbi:hypothetical protein F0U60_04710 [Archangium minus]|uniref:Lipoprotein n=1 Tax=Archangium minus TaxID=83450 RepID=A0ABY9WIU1_9BACT|nr:hypothetical protein F0U60_04710 [Archangium minus]